MNENIPTTPYNKTCISENVRKKALLLCACTIALQPTLIGQITLSTTTGNNYSGNSGFSGNSTITFVIENTTSNDYVISDVEVYWRVANNNTNVSLWKSTTSISGPPTISTPNWTQVVSAGPIAVPSDGYYPTFTNVGDTVPSNTVVRYAIQSSSGIRYSIAPPAPTPNSFSYGGLTLHTGNHHINSSAVGYGGGFPSPTNSPRWFTGSVTFLVPGISEDIGLVGAGILSELCPSVNDSAFFILSNTVGDTVDFSTDSLEIVWEVNGPIHSSGTLLLNSGILASGGIDTFFVSGLNLSKHGNYTLNAHISTNVKNQWPGNDTLATLHFEMDSIFWVEPNRDTITSSTDSVEIKANSLFFPVGTVFITEICHLRGAAIGVPVGGWPSYLIADDYIEITGQPNFDLGGYTLEQWTHTTLISSHTFPSGTYFSPQGTMIVAVGQLGQSQPSPSNFYYHGGSTYNFQSSEIAGRIIKDSVGNIVDAVGYGNYNFPSAANVSANDWSGSTPAQINSAGNRLAGFYTKDASNWISSAVSPQDPNTLNSGVVVPSPGVSGLMWTTGGVMVDTVPDIYVGPFRWSGTYTYVASYPTPCGVLTDTAWIYADFCGDPEIESIAVNCDVVEISWLKDPAETHAELEYGPVGFALGSGTAIGNVTSPYIITGLTGGQDYDIYIRSTCNTSTANSGWAGPYTFTLDSAAMADFSISTADNVTFDFDASQSVKATGYHWDFGDGNTGSGVITSHTYTQGGGFTVILSITSDCEPDTTSQTLASAVDVGKWEIAKIKAYPNPTKGIIVIENLHPSIQGSELLVYSAMGVMVKKFVIGDVSTQTFDLGDLPSGVYNLRISNSSGAWNIAQIVVQ